MMRVRVAAIDMKMHTMSAAAAASHLRHLQDYETLIHAWCLSLYVTGGGRARGAARGAPKGEGRASRPGGGATEG